MKGFGLFLKILGAMLAIAAAIYVGIAYGDKIVAWVKKVCRLGRNTDMFCFGSDCDSAEDIVAAADNDFVG